MVEDRQHSVLGESSRRYRATAALMTGWLLATAFAGIPAFAQSNNGRTPARMLDGQVRAIPGPKRTVAVSRFASKTDFTAQYGLADIGGGLAAMLTAALAESGQFIVVERETLSDILAEQKLTATGLVRPEGAPVPGEMIGAGLLIKGAVTEFSESAGGGGFGLGVAGIGVGLKTRKAMVGLDIQVIDAATSQVVASFPVRESVSAKSVGVDVTRNGVSTGYNQFFSTPIGTATRKAITTAVQRFADQVSSRPWTGRVVDVDSGDVVINAGAASGIRPGDRFVIERVASVFTDPATGRVLGQKKVTVGTLIVGGVDDEIAFGRFQPISTVAIPMRGDLVVMSSVN
jgi:curli biogenesis system outer membrane secretion channel CsgG